jgi:hypothetical protein
MRNEALPDVLTAIGIRDVLLAIRVIPAGDGALRLVNKIFNGSATLESALLALSTDVLQTVVQQLITPMLSEVTYCRRECMETVYCATQMVEVAAK